MYAIIEDSGTQIKVTPGQVVEVDLREVKKDAKSVTFDRVLLVGGDNSAKIGSPYVNGASVTAEIVNANKVGDKTTLVKYKRRKGYKVKKGHRQRYMQVKITGING
ncbi:MAG TPA: 50S ribosomal protein L21 [Phycisphaerales bacterium]|nr:50S ribosomal protein L21 [Phycisphaerales bacterium]